ncbi:hypothetical protein SCOR_21040 [Sulfidibacter corallicola]|uniref:Uncharacterized protein n=1 Tax=Sulfidibacter corallicola TaxID=2818388 RepID=A0A8A4TUP3_SULCO|nr:hypothetical protein [Sulfidibacter corallicola]QTD53077.1 hypothetical protein J3U87_11500 [Sulfidibacter corallicola]
MLIKANFLCEDRWISGKVDVPKIKKRFCKKHFGLVALLNFPHLSLEAQRVGRNHVLVQDARIHYFGESESEKADEVAVSLEEIQCAYEDSPKEKTFFEKNFFEMVNPQQRLMFFCRSGLQIEGEFLDDVNEVSLTKGKGFLSVANAMLACKHNYFSTLLTPYLTINNALFIQMAKSRAPKEQHLELPEMLANVS